MRGDMGLRMHLLWRPAGIVGVATAVAGLVAFAATYLPWYRVTATLAMLGGSGATSAAELAGWQAHMWGWVVAVLGIGAIGAGIALAIDRPLPPFTAGLCGLGLVATAALGALLRPPVERFDVGGSELRELVRLADRLPPDVDLALEVGTAGGLWATLAAGMLIAGAAAYTQARL